MRLLKEDREEYARTVWRAWCAKRGDDGLELMSPADWALLAGWMDAGVPLRVVLRGIQDCAGKVGPRTRLAYAESAVEEEARRWRKALEGGGE